MSAPERAFPVLRITKLQQGARCFYSPFAAVNLELRFNVVRLVWISRIGRIFAGVMLDAANGGIDLRRGLVAFMLGTARTLLV